jgi:hypothetical protein
MCMFCSSLFVLLYLFFWPLCCLFFFDIRILTTSLIHCVFKLFLLSIMTHSMSKYFALVHPRGFQWFFYQALMVCVLFGRSLFIFLSAFLPLYCYGRDRRGHDPITTDVCEFVRISIRVMCTTLCDNVCQWLPTDQWFFLRVFNKTNRHTTTEILLKVALNTIKQTYCYGF